jgi:hypothetical protein
MFRTSQVSPETRQCISYLLVAVADTSMAERVPATNVSITTPHDLPSTAAASREISVNAILWKEQSTSWLHHAPDTCL